MCSFASDVKEKHKVKNKKTKARSLRTEIKKSSSSKDFNHYILSNIQCNLWPETLKVGQETAMFIVTHLKLHYLRLKLWVWPEEDLVSFNEDWFIETSNRIILFKDDLI